MPGALWTYASGINNHGNIVLFWSTGDGRPVESSIYNGKTYKTINVPGADSSTAEDLANSGDVSYLWWDSKFHYHGALFHGGKYTKFDFPKSVQTYGRGINDHHVLVGGYEAKTNGPVRGYKATYK